MPPASHVPSAEEEAARDAREMDNLAADIKALCRTLTLPECMKWVQQGQAGQLWAGWDCQGGSDSASGNDEERGPANMPVYRLKSLTVAAATAAAYLSCSVPHERLPFFPAVPMCRSLLCAGACGTCVHFINSSLS